MTLAAVERLNAGLSGRYRLEREVGAGGMATVYLAEDLRHHRPVAVKVLRSEIAAVLGAQRFLKEIEVTAGLNHPHILPLFDSGTVPATSADGSPDPSGSPFLFYVMPFVEGESLRARLDREKQLSVDQAIELTRQVADALDYAHRRGVVHRDIKPENILIHEGRALVADFGIALAVTEAGGDRLTETGLSLGTPPYMSPEQITGERQLDARSDLYSLGCVLYEMLAGDPPFSGRTTQAIVARKLTGTIPSLRPVRENVTEGLDRVIAKALSRTPADRYPTIAQFAEELTRGASGAMTAAEPAGAPSGQRRWPRVVGITVAVAATIGVLWATGRDRITSWLASPPRFARIAILPLENRTGDSTQNYLVDGLTEGLIADLARLEKVDVISLASTLGYRTKPKPVDSVARELGVDAVVAGSVGRRDGRLRAELRLLTPGGAAPAIDTLERAATEVAPLGRAMVAALVRTIGGRLASKRPGDERSSSPAVHDLFLRGRYHLASRTPEGLQNAVDYFRQVLAQDPAHAGAYAGLAQYYALLPFYQNTAPADDFTKAKAAALRAVELDPYLPEAHTSLAYTLAYGDWDWVGAERSYRRALALQPSNADTYHALSRLHAALGRIPEAVAEAERAHVLDPLSLVAHANIGIVAYFGRDYAEARRRLLATLEIDPAFSTAQWGLGLVFEQLGQYDEAIAQIEKAIAIDGRGSNLLSSLGHVLSLAGRKTEAEKILTELVARGGTGPVRPYMQALVLVGLGRHDDAIAMLERAYQDRSTLLSYLSRDPRFDSLRTSPRFTALERKMNLVP